MEKIMEWYSVKTLYKWEASEGNSDKKSSGILLEERIVLIKAASFDDAIKLGEEEAKKYNKEWKNSEGELVRIRYIDSCDVYLLANDINEGLEVFSMTIPFDDDVSDIELENFCFGEKLDEEVEKKIRSKFSSE